MSSNVKYYGMNKKLLRGNVPYFQYCVVFILDTWWDDPSHMFNSSYLYVKNERSTLHRTQVVYLTF